MPNSMLREPISQEHLHECVAGGASRISRFVAEYQQALPSYIDDITRDFGDDLYERMMKDSQVASCVQLLKLAAIDDGYYLRPAIEDQDDKDYKQAVEIQDFCQDSLDNLPRTYNDLLYEMADGVVLGNKIAEVTYESSDERYVLAEIKPKPRRSLAFVVDPFNNVVGLLPHTVPYPTRLQADEILPRNKFAIYTFNPTDNDPRGHSIARPAYNSWNFKIQIWPEYMKFLAQFAGPSVVGELPETALSVTQIDGTQISPQQDMLNALQLFRNGTALVHAHGGRVYSLFNGGTGEAFKSAIEIFDRQITKAILLQTLATEEGEHQARASSEVHRGLLDYVVQHLRRGLCAMTEFDVLYWLVYYNFGEKAARKLTPKCGLGKQEENDWFKEAEAIARLMATGYIDGSQLGSLDERLGLPVRGEIPQPVKPQPIIVTDGVGVDDDEAEFAHIKLPSGKEIVPVLKAVFAKQREKVLARLEESTVTFADLPDRFVGIGDWDDEIAENVRPILEAFYKRGAKEILTRVGASPDIFSVVTPNIGRAVAAASLKFSQSTNETTSMQLNDALDRLRKELAEGLVKGEARALLRERVNAVFDNASQSRAQTIADSEASRALHGGQQIAAEKSGVVAKKKWLASDDACLACLAVYESQPDGGIDVDANFVNGSGPYGDVPYPPLHPSCTCSVSYELAEQYQEAIEGE